MTTLNFLCAGAAQGLVKALQDRFTADTGASVQGRFGAVGAMKEALLAGEPCDVMIVTGAMIDALCADGALRAETRTPLGRVRTGIAVRSGSPLPDVATPEALKAALLAADSVYFPDAVRATAGIHFANVMRELGILGTLEPRFRTYPAGAIAMRELAASTSPHPIGCTQITEINYTPGVQLVGALPPAFELATTYTAAVSTRAANAALAERFIALIAGPASQPLRAAGGFEI
jgi:molybdate transport system substrate-binding protein